MTRWHTDAMLGVPPYRVGARGQDPPDLPHLNRLRGLLWGKLLLLPHLPIALVTVLAHRNSRTITANHRLLL